MATPTDDKSDQPYDYDVVLTCGDDTLFFEITTKNPSAKAIAETFQKWFFDTYKPRITKVNPAT